MMDRREQWVGGSVRPHAHPTFTPIQLFSMWGPVVAVAVFIFYLSSVPHLRLVEAWWDFPLRKAGHMAIFGLLARLLARALTGSTLWPWKRIFAISLIATTLYAITDEYHQSFTPGRGPSAGDVIIDTVGAWLALGIIP